MWNKDLRHLLLLTVKYPRPICHRTLNKLIQLQSTDRLTSAFHQAHRYELICILFGSNWAFVRFALYYLFFSHRSLWSSRYTVSEIRLVKFSRGHAALMALSGLVWIIVKYLALMSTAWHVRPMKCGIYIEQKGSLLPVCDNPEMFLLIHVERDVELYSQRQRRHQ